ncbi:MAG: hypothetical protein WCO05_00010 [Candidatus Moraniibacteriota bacterium]
MKKKFLTLALFLAFILFNQKAQATAVSPTTIPPAVTSETVPRQVDVGNQQGEVGKMTVIADINFRDPSIIKQENNKLILYFSLENKFPKSEAGIRYGVQLIKDKTLIDEKVYTDDVLSVESNNFIQKIFSYDAPGYLFGDFELWLVSENESGLPLATFKFEKPLTLMGTGEYLEINNKSCSLKIEGDKDNKIYSLMQGVSLKPEETLRLNCEVISHFKEAVTISPSYSTFERTLFGNLVDRDRKGAELTFQSGEKKTVNLAIEKPKNPQAYEVKVDLVQNSRPVSGQLINAKVKKTDSAQNNISVSSPVIFHYVIAGESATIRKLDLDKISYQKGDIINATLRWSGSADNFGDSRTGNTKDNTVLLSLDISDDANQKCADSLEETLEPNSPEAKLALTAKINCTDPKVKVTLKNGQGVVLAQKEFNYLKNKEISPKQPGATAPTAKHKSSNSVIIIILILVLVVTLILFFLKKRNKTGKLLFLLLLGVLFSCRLQNVRAITIDKPYNSWGDFCYSVNLNKGSGPYDTGEAMSVTYSGSATNTGCFDHDGNTTLLASTNTSDSWSDVSWRGNQNFKDGNCNVSIPSSTWNAGSAPSSSGSISLIACITGEGSLGVRSYCSGTSSGGGNFDSASGSIPYTVRGATPLPTPTCDINFGSGTYTAGSWGTMTWSSTNTTNAYLTCSLGSSVLVNGAEVYSSTSSYATKNYGVSLASAGTVACTLKVVNSAASSESTQSTCSAWAVVSGPIPTPKCVASFSVVNIQAPGTAYLSWYSFDADKTIGSCSGIGSPVPAADYGLAYDNYPIAFVATDSGTETCTFTPYIGATAGTPCSASVLVRSQGVCGSADGTSSCTQPTTGLCGSSSTASAVTGTGPWNWTCTGASGGGSVSCSATKSCALASCHASFSPSSILTSSTTPGVSVLAWDSTGDSMTVSCTGPMPISPAMSVVNPASGSGPVPFTVDQTGIEKCTFTPYNGVTPGTTCEATVSVRADAICGSASGGTSCLAPTSNLCTLGTLLAAPTVYSGTWWGWTCLGLNGGANGSCSTTIDCASPSCVANFSPTSLTAPGTASLTWVPSNADKMLGTCSGIGAIIPESDYGLSNTVGYPFAFTALQTGTETCTFTPYMGATKGAPCSASVVVRDTCECSTIVSTGVPCPVGTTCDGCNCISPNTCMPLDPPVGTTRCPLTRETGLSSVQAWTDRITLSACTGVLGICEYYTPIATFGCDPSDPPTGIRCAGTRESGFSVSQSWTPVGTVSSCTGLSGICEYYTPAGTFGCDRPDPPPGHARCPATQESGFSSVKSWLLKASLSACTGPTGICEYYPCPTAPQCYYPTTCSSGGCGIQYEACLSIPASLGCTAPACLSTSCTGTMNCPCNSGGWQEISH